MPDGQTWWRSQREIREGKAPRRLAERRDLQAAHDSRRWSGAAYLAKRVALAVSVVCLVIAYTIVHNDDYSPASGPYVGSNVRAESERVDVANASGSEALWLSRSWRF
jgi:hypothetical protein